MGKNMASLSKGGCKERPKHANLSTDIVVIKSNVWFGCCNKTTCCKIPLAAGPVQLIWPLCCCSFTGIF